jgi:hypothetical protein
MRTTTIIALLAGGALLACGVSRAAPLVPPRGPEAEVRDEAQHQLLMLDLREAVDHARTLHHYARVHVKDLESDIVGRHVDELTRNLQSIESALGAFEQRAGGVENTAVRARLAAIRMQQQIARSDLDALKQEVAREQPDRRVILERSRAIDRALTLAQEHHRTLMSWRGVPARVERTPAK